MKMLRCALAAPLLLTLATTVSGAPIDFGAGLGSADVMIDFNSTSPGPASTLFQSQGVTFSGVTGTVAVVSGPSYAGFSGNHLSAGGSSNTPHHLVNAFEIQFSGTVTAAAFRLVTNPGTSKFIAYLGGNGGTLVEEYVENTNYWSTGNNWFGFENITFDTLRIEPGGTNGVVHLDDLRFSGLTAVPEPTTLVILGFGLAGIGFSQRKRLS